MAAANTSWHHHRPAKVKSSKNSRNNLSKQQFIKSSYSVSLLYFNVLQAAVIYQELEGIPATTSGLQDQKHVASSSPIPSSNACDGLDDNYGYQHEEQGAADDDETSLEETVIDADTMPAFFSHVEDADASAPRFK